MKVTALTGCVCVLCASYDVHYDASSASSSLPFHPHHTSSSDNLVFQLETTANRLKNAFHGVEVSWVDSGKIMDSFIN